MPKKFVVLLVGATEPLLFIFLLLLLSAGGSGSSADTAAKFAAIPQTERYAETASKLGAPWDVVMLTDAIYAAREDKGDVDGINPIHTALQFSVMLVTEEHYEVVGYSYNELIDRWEPSYDWVVSGSETFTAKEEIIAALGIDEDELDHMSAEDFTLAMTTAMAKRGGKEYRYTATISANYNVSAVLHSYTTLTEEEISQVLELYHADYLLESMDEEARTRICQIMGEYGMYQHVDLDAYVNCEGVVFTGGVTDVVYYNQLDQRWANSPYGTDKIGIAGCGPTAMAMVISSLTEETVAPVYMAAWAAEKGFWVKGKGSAHVLIPAAAAEFGLSCVGCSRAEPQRIVDALERGDLVVALMTKGHFTNGGHFIVLRGVTEDGKILVADPSSAARSDQSWDLSLIVSEAHKSAAAGGPFWIIGN